MWPTTSTHACFLAVIAVATATTSAHAVAGTPLPSFRMSIMMDASTKPCRFATAGAAQPHPPRTSTHLSSVAHDVVKDFEAGILTSDAQQRYAEQCAAEQAGTVCSSNLTCSRPSASARGVVDVSGLAGAFCSHCTAGRDAMVAMRTPEQHAYHERTFASVLLRRPDLRDAYIDIGCRLKPLLMAVVSREVEAGNLLPDVLEEVGARLCGCFGS
mgnify:FL=1